MKRNDIKTLTDLHEELRANGLPIIDFIVALCETSRLEEAAERCAELGGDMDAIANIIMGITERGL